MGKTNKFFLGAALFALTCGGAAFLTLKGNQVQETDATSTVSTLLPTNSSIPNTMPSTNISAITVDGVSYSGLFYATSTSYIMFNSSTGFIYNTSDLGNIVSIVISYNAGGSSAAYQSYTFGTSAMNARKISGYDGRLTTSTGGTSATIQPTASNKGFFNVSISNKNMQITSFAVTYSPVVATTPTVSLSSTTCTIDSDSDVTTTIVASAKNFTDSTLTWACTDNNDNLVGEVLTSNGNKIEFISGHFSTSTTVTVTVTATGSTTTSETASTTLSVTIKPYLVSISVSTTPTNTSYNIGDALDTSGAVITATLNDSSTEDVTSEAVYSPTTMSSSGTQTITVTVTRDTYSFTTSFTVTVSSEVLAWYRTLAKADFTTETQMAADGATSVTGCLVQNGASALGDTGNQETWYSSYTYSTLATDTASLPYVGSLDSSRGLQFGTTKHPFETLTFESGLFVAHQGVSNEYSISKITVDAATASGNNGVATLNVSLDGTAVGSAVTLTNTSTVYTFTTSTVKTGHIKLAFANPGTTLATQAAIYIKNIKVYATCVSDETGMLFHIGQDLENLDTCNIASADWTIFKNKTEATLNSTYAEIYGAYTTELASVSLYDYAATGTGARAKTATVTAAAKYAAIASRIAASGQAKVSLAGSSESYITLSVFAVLGGLALAGFFFLKKKRLEA